MKKIRFYKGLIIEIVETLITISKIITRDMRGVYVGRYRNVMEGHIEMLSRYSKEMRGIYERKEARSDVSSDT